MANPIYAAIRQELEQKRREAQRAAKQRKSEIYAKIPALSELDREMSLKAAEYSMRIINGEDVDNEMKEALAKLSERKKACLLEHGLTGADFEPHYSCPVCHDTGVADGGYCSCFKARVIEENFNSSNIGKTLDYQSFDSFDLNFYPDEKTDNYPCTPRENMKRNLAVCQTFADKFDFVKKSLLLIGGTGLGKTFLSTCVAKRLLMSGKSVIYISAVDFFKRIEKSRFDASDSDIRMFESCDLLIIDDLGTEAPSVYTTAVFSDILDKRWRCGKKLMISSNNRLTDFERLYGERVFSRLAGGFECLLFYGRDIRVQKFMNGDS
ncbi:MAG: ATP-binding protein [Clostridia bacterium]|nr:ATP-binding protein [Clostridia bacterium]